jgi:hypothetical protein
MRGGQVQDGRVSGRLILAFVLLSSQGTVATGVGAPGNQIQFAPLTLSGRADYLDVNREGSVSAWVNG